MQLDRLLERLACIELSIDRAEAHGGRIDRKTQHFQYDLIDGRARRQSHDRPHRILLGFRRLELLHDVARRIDDERLVFLGDLATRAMLNRQRECRDQHHIHRRCRTRGFDFVVDDFERFIFIARQQALVITHVRLQCRLVGEDHRKKAQRLHMPPQNGDAYRQGCSEQQTDRAPNPNPEQGGNQQRERRHAGALAEDDRFDEVGEQQIQREIQRERLQRLGPAGKHCKGEQRRHDRGQHRADEGHEAQRGSQSSPQSRVRHADPIQPSRRNQSERHIEQHLRADEATHALRRLVHQARGHRHVRCADQTDETISQILALAEHERDQHEHDHCARKRLENRLHPFLHALHRREPRWHDAHRLGAALIGEIFIELFGDLIDRAREPVQRRVIAELQLANLFAHRGGVLRHLLRQLRELHPGHIADRTHGAQRNHHRQQHAEKTRKTHAIEHAHQRGQQKRQDDAERERHQHGLRCDQHASDQNDREQRAPRPVHLGDDWSVWHGYSQGTQMMGRELTRGPGGSQRGIR